jgi:hypothetical protein
MRVFGHTPHQLLQPHRTSLAEDHAMNRLTDVDGDFETWLSLRSRS